MATPPTPTEDLQRVVDALARASGNQTHAASALDMGRSKFTHRMREAMRRGLVPTVATDEPEPEPPTLGEVYGTPPPEPAFVHGPCVEYVSNADNTFTFGVVSDNHAGSKYERLDVADDLFEWFGNEAADRVFHAGNWIDGEKFAHNCHTIGLDAQVCHLINTWPKVGLDTYAISGDDHEGWYAQQQGVNVGRYCQHRFRDHGRLDWIDLGYMEAFIRLVNANTGKAAVMSVVHPGGGTAYAISYSVQRIISELEGGEKPAVGIYGHWHKMLVFDYRNVWILLPGCLQDQTPFMRKKPGASAHVGGMLVTLEQDEETGAIVACTPRMRKYYNRGYYQDRWNMSGPVTLPERTVR